MDNRVIVSVSLFDNETYFLSKDFIYITWSSSFSNDTKQFENFEEARKFLKLNFDKLCKSLGENKRFIDQIKLLEINLLYNDQYEIIREEYFVGGIEKDE